MQSEASDDLSSESADEMQLEQMRLANFGDLMTDLQQEQINRQGNLKNFDKVVSRLIKKGNATVGCQTDPVEFKEEDDEEDDKGKKRKHKMNRTNQHSRDEFGDTFNQTLGTGMAGDSHMSPNSTMLNS